MCPITNVIKGYPFEVLVPPESGSTGAILADQVRSMDWNVRDAQLKGHVSESVIQDVFDMVGALLDG